MKPKIISVFLIVFSFYYQALAQIESLKEDVTVLSSDIMEGRQTGTKGEAEAAKYISQRFSDLKLIKKGTDGYFQTFSFKPKTNPHDEVVFINTSEDGTITGTNILGYIDNNAPNTIIIGAHYDHLGYGGDGSLDASKAKSIHNGADDNASGVAVMLDLAKKLQTTNTNNNYLFMAFSGEEMGLLGSNFFVKNATLDIKNVNYMINMDMVGRLNTEKTLAVYGVGTTPRFKQSLTVNNTGFKLVEHASGVGPSDHTSFYLADIPVLHFFTGQHEDYHKPSDDYDKLNYEGMNSISHYIFDVISDLNIAGKLPFRATKNESEEVPRFKVGLGVMPDYMYDGVGMRIDGVIEDRAAQKAGILKGDVIIKIGDYDTQDMMAYMKALSTFKEGDSTTIVLEREGKQVTVTLVF